MVDKDYLFSPSEVIKLVGEEGVPELLGEYQILLRQHLALPLPSIGEEVEETFFRSVHSLKSSSQFIGASVLADLCLKLETECKQNEFCSGSLLSLSLQVRKYAKELDGQVTNYLSM